MAWLSTSDRNSNHLFLPKNQGDDDLIQLKPFTLQSTYNVLSIPKQAYFVLLSPKPEIKFVGNII